MPERGESKVEWTAEMVKDKLRRRHAATQPMGVRSVPGPWTCIEELLGCDLVAFSAVQRPHNGPGKGATYPRVGYEVKVSRADYRKELRQPWKREKAVGYCHAFYFAVPLGLLDPFEVELRVGDPEGTALWVPDDVGLVVVHRGGCRIIHEAPVRREPEAVDGDLLGVCARHISSHPDPRHEGVVEADRALCAQLREAERERRKQHDRMVAEWQKRNAASDAEAAA